MGNYLKSVHDLFNRVLVKCKKPDKVWMYIFTGFILSVFSLFVLSDLAEDYMTSGSFRIDGVAFKYVYSIRDVQLNKIFVAVTSTGNFVSVITITLIAAFILLHMKKRGEAIFFSSNILGVWLFNELLKYIFKRPRPSEIWLVNATDYSFPSGHSMIFMGLSLFIIYYILLYVKNKKLAVLLTVLVFAYSLLVGLSRVYVGVHYLSDVVAGWSGGTLWSSSSILIYRAVGSRNKLYNTGDDKNEYGII